jgi:spermidine synthase
MDLKRDIGALNLWATEIHRDNVVGLSFKVKNTLFSGKSKFQQIDVVETDSHGVMLFIDGITMLSERDEFVYHEMIAHVPLFVHPSPKKVLVVGGGDGGSVREIVKHPELEKVVMVEIDEMVVDLSKKYLPSVSSAMNSPKLELIIDDAIKYVETTKEVFDVVIVDSTDPIGPGAALFGKPFYENISKILGPDGIMVTQCESPFYDADLQKPILENQRPFFKKVHLYLYASLAYPGGIWSFSYASKGLCPVKNFDPARVKASGVSTRYYNAQIHVGAFALPTFMTENLGSVMDSVEIF